ncbi:MAG TPA: hypothetical protein VF760_15115, partial [Xanthobacteraceae bacterium]
VLAMNAIMGELADTRLGTSSTANIGLYMAPLGKAGLLHIRRMTKPWNIAIAGCSEFRTREVVPVV